MAGATLDLRGILSPENLASSIANMWMEWNGLRSSWLAEKDEVRNYIFATDTTKTGNKFLPWKNSTTLPKLCQIRDNLHANYMAALFPNEEWLEWEGDDRDSVSEEKADVIEAFMYNKTRASDFKDTVSRLVYDWIDYGNVFATVDFVDESVVDESSGVTIPGYQGPKLYRVSPFDIVFNPIASDFSKTPKIVRVVKSLGELKKELDKNPNDKEAQDAFNKAVEIRTGLKGLGEDQFHKNHGFQVDGFSSFTNYFASGMVEVLTFYGDMYDVEAGKLYENHIITVIDRCTVLSKKPNPSWIGSDNFFHHGWRLRPDNLYAMGPLDNLIGMQYRIDHLENLKADAFDLIAFPMLKIIGEVQEFSYGPNERIICGDEGDVQFMHPDATALQADTQIAILEAKMEQMAGAPREAMGIRTPGEKTAFEVQSLQNSASRIFENKTLAFESQFLCKILNAMLEVGRRKMSTPELVKNLASDIDVVTFETVSADDLKATGKIRPVGASHFAKQARLIQNLVQLLNSPVGRDPAINVHLSGKAIAKLSESIMELDKFDIYGDNIRIIEQMETQRLINDGQEQLQVESQTPPGTVPGDEASGNIAAFPQG